MRHPGQGTVIRREWMLSFVNNKAAESTSESDIVDGIIKAFAARANMAIRPKLFDNMFNAVELELMERIG